MAEIINLRRLAKNKRRRAKATKAARNRAAFGRTKPDKTRDRAALQRQHADLDGKKLDRPPTPDDGSGGRTHPPSPPEPSTGGFSPQGGQGL